MGWLSSRLFGSLFNWGSLFRPPGGSASLPQKGSHVLCPVGGEGGPSVVSRSNPCGGAVTSSPAAAGDSSHSPANEGRQPRHQQQEREGQTANDGGGGLSECDNLDWRRSLQLSAILGLAFNLFHHQLRVRTIAAGSHQKHQTQQAGSWTAALCPRLEFPTHGSSKYALPSWKTTPATPAPNTAAATAAVTTTTSVTTFANGGGNRRYKVQRRFAGALTKDQVVQLQQQQRQQRQLQLLQQGQRCQQQTTAVNGGQAQSAVASKPEPDREAPSCPKSQSCPILNLENTLSNTGQEENQSCSDHTDTDITNEKEFSDDVIESSDVTSKESVASSSSHGSNSSIKEEGDAEKSHQAMVEAEQAMVSIGETHLAVQLVLNGNKEQGMALLLKAARKGHAEATYNLGVICEQNGEEKQALRFYQAAAHANYAAAFFNLAVFHEQGKAGLKPSVEKAIEFYEKAAALGLDEAADELESRGLGTAKTSHKDERKRSKRKKGQQLYGLARAYHYGWSGVAKDKHRAAELYRVAAEAGHEKARKAYKKLLQEFLLEIDDKEEAERRSLPEETETRTELMIGTNGF